MQLSRLQLHVVHAISGVAGVFSFAGGPGSVAGSSGSGQGRDGRVRGRAGLRQAILGSFRCFDGDGLGHPVLEQAGPGAVMCSKRSRGSRAGAVLRNGTDRAHWDDRADSLHGNFQKIKFLAHPCVAAPQRNACTSSSSFRSCRAGSFPFSFGIIMRIGVGIGAWVCPFRDRGVVPRKVARWGWRCRL